MHISALEERKRDLLQRVDIIRQIKMSTLKLQSEFLSQRLCALSDVLKVCAFQSLIVSHLSLHVNCVFLESCRHKAETVCRKIGLVFAKPKDFQVLQTIGNIFGFCFTKIQQAYMKAHKQAFLKTFFFCLFI